MSCPESQSLLCSPYFWAVIAVFAGVLIYGGWQWFKYSSKKTLSKRGSSGTELPEPTLMEKWLKANGLPDQPTNKNIFLHFFGMDNKRPIRILENDENSGLLKISLTLRTSQAIIFHQDLYLVKFYIDNTLEQPELSIKFKSQFLEKVFWFDPDLPPEETLQTIYWDSDVILPNNIESLSIVLPQNIYDKIYMPLI